MATKKIIPGLFSSTLFAIILLTFCSGAKTFASPPPSRSVVNISIDDTPRSYILHLPPTYDGKAKIPLVMLLHGATDSAAYAEQAYHFAEKSSVENFILVLPDAIGENHAWHSFDPNTSETPNNDLRFLTRLLRTLPKIYAIDSNRMYVCGHSSGAMMTYRLAAEHPELIAAAGIVAGAVDPDTILPKAAVPLIIFHGKVDPTLAFTNLAPAVDLWKKINQCDLPSLSLPVAGAAPSPVLPSTVHYIFYSSAIGADIAVYVLDNGNHMWPGGKAMPGKSQIPVQDISATDLMWAFFVDHPKRPAGTLTNGRPATSQR